MSDRMLAKKRIEKDIKEITDNPLEGIGIAPIDESLMRYVINMRLMTGPYTGYCIQLLLTFSDKYPTKPPKILIYPDQAISGQYHHHIFDDVLLDDKRHHFKKFCFDLLDNDFMATTEAKTGWNPSYSISSLLLQVQNFISDPDMGGHVPDDYLISQLFKSMENYTRTFTIVNEDGILEQKIHTWENPYPEMYSKQKEKDEEDYKQKLYENDEEFRLQQIKENLTCFMLKVNYIDDPTQLLGYPIVWNQIQLRTKNRLELYPIPELLTYDGFKAQKSLQGFMVQQYFNLNDNNAFKSANNEKYNSWLPIYINKDHYEKNKNRILKSIAEITNNTEFKPEQIFQVLPVILNSMIIGMYNGKTTLSSSFIRCYFQFILLFKKLCQEYQIEYSIYLNEIFNNIKENDYKVNKTIIPDIGNFFIVLLFNKLDINNEILQKIRNSIFEDFIIRQMYWMFHSAETKDNMKNLILSDKKNIFFVEKFENDPNFKMNNLVKFNDDLHEKNIFKEVIDIISTDEGYLGHIFIGKEKAREIAEKRIKQSFKRLFLECTQEGKKKLKDIILKNLYFPSYFGAFETPEGQLYDNFQVHKILKDLDKSPKKKEFLKTAFEHQRGNQLLIITFFAQKKVEEPNFLEQLEKNYGVFLNVDYFIKDMNKTLSEITTYKALFEYVGADFMKNEKDNTDKYKDDLDLIIAMYKKALDKNYIGKNFQKPLADSNMMNIYYQMPPPTFNYGYMPMMPLGNSSQLGIRSRPSHRYNYDNRRDNGRRQRRHRRRRRSRSRSYSDDYDSRSHSRSRSHSLSHSYSDSYSDSYNK